MKRILAIILVLAMLVPLAACGGSSTTASQQAEATPTPEYTYDSKFQNCEVETSSDLSIQLFTDDGFYFTTAERVEGEIPEGVTPDYEGQYDTIKYILNFSDYSGKIKKLDGFSSIEALNPPEDGQYSNVTSFCNVFGLAINDAGNFEILENRWCSYTDAPDLIWDDPDYADHQFNFNEYWIRELNPDGSEISRAQIQCGNDDYFSGGKILDDEGNLLVIKDNTIIGVKTDGSFAYTIELDNIFPDSLLKMRDGKIFVCYYGDIGMQLAPIDFSTKSLGQAVDIKGYSATFTGGGDYQLYYTDGINFKGFNLGDEDAAKLFSWLDCGINSNYTGAGYTNVLEDGTIINVSFDYDQDESGNVSVKQFEIATISKVPFDPAAQKHELTLGTITLSWDAQQNILDFNKNNDKYKLRVIEYYENGADWDAAVEKMKTEIIAGYMPDILDLDLLPVKQLALKGFLEDLTPYIENDSEINLDDLFPNVLATVKFDDKIISTVSSFSVQTVIGASSIVGDTPGWNYKQFNAALAKMPEGCEPFDAYMTREVILRNCLNLDMNDFVNWDTGKVDFMNDEFYDLLNFAAAFPVEYNWDDFDYEETTEQRIGEGRQMCMFGYMSDFDNILYEGSMFGNMPTTYVGLPTNNGVGNMLNVGTGYAISSKCSDKDAAWQFVRSFMTNKYMESQFLFPASMSLFEKRLAAAKEVQYQKDANGNYTLDSEGNKIPVTRISYSMPDGSEVKIYNLSDELAEKVKDVVYNTTKAAAYDEEINTIVMNQAEAFFSGQKSAQDVAKLIQSQVSIYVNEQR